MENDKIYETYTIMKGMRNAQSLVRKIKVKRLLDRTRIEGGKLFSR
jgi:hypothetical protein